jgi:hypothetical protein
MAAEIEQKIRAQVVPQAALSDAVEADLAEPADI